MMQNTLTEVQSGKAPLCLHGSCFQPSNHQDTQKMLSIRATKTNAWFLDQYSRALSRQGSKKTSNVDLATAENWLIRPEIMKLLRGKCCLDLEPRHLSYASGLGGQPELLSSLATFYNSFFEPYTPVKPDHLVVGPGCSAIIDTLIHDVCDSGDGLLVAKPMWGESIRECFWKWFH
jgi:histidinol-phosphate/aromatic aminotransferase/cobyric acid decarboxylase-like protein